MKLDCTAYKGLILHGVMQIGGGQAGRQARRQAGRQAGRQTGRQTGRQPSVRLAGK